MPNLKKIQFPRDWVDRKTNGHRISVITAYDATFSSLFASTEIDAILVGDSLAMTVQGHRTTLPATLDEMIYHCKMVRRGAPDSFIIGDMPFGSYQTGVEPGISACFRMIKEGHVDAVKLEGAEAVTVQIIKQLTAAGVPVMGHIGLTPQSYLKIGGYRVQGKTETEAQRLAQEAATLEEAGCFSLVMELIVAQVASEITNKIRIPSIGIGSGIGTTGQVLVMHDLLGMDPKFQARHAKKYADLAVIIRRAAEEYHQEVHSGVFPGEAQSF